LRTDKRRTLASVAVFLIEDVEVYDKKDVSALCEPEVHFPPPTVREGRALGPS